MRHNLSVCGAAKLEYQNSLNESYHVKEDAYLSGVLDHDSTTRINVLNQEIIAYDKFSSSSSILLPS